MHVLLANRAACYMRLLPADVDSAVQDCERCVALEPRYVKGWLRLAKYNLDSSHKDEALAAVRRGLEHHPEHAELEAMFSFEGIAIMLLAEDRRRLSLPGRNDGLPVHPVLSASACR